MGLRREPLRHLRTHRRCDVRPCIETLACDTWSVRYCMATRLGNPRNAREGMGVVSAEEDARGPKFLFFKFVHNALVHPLLSLPWEPRWAQRAHDWTARRCYGAG